VNVGIIGRARAGKDTAGRWLVENRGYERVAFADVLKDVALRIDPIVSVGYPCEATRLSETVAGQFGWESAKETGDVRRFLQELGASIRAIDPDFWLRAALAKADAINADAGRPVVITDVRYANEAAALRARGWHLVHIDRPGVPHLVHESEGALTADDADYAIANVGDVSSLHGAVELFHHRVHTIESARQYGRAHA
jgi:hypothetical protein